MALDQSSVAVEGEELADIVATVNLIVAHAPFAALELLETSSNRKMRRILLDAIPTAPGALPLVRARLASPSWFVVRNAVILLGRCGGTGDDLALVARHPNEKVRLEVVRALRAVPHEAKTTDVLVGYLTDSSQDVAAGARALLRGEHLGPGAVPTLERLASDEQQGDELRKSYIGMLGRSPTDAAANALWRLLQPRGLLDLGSAAAIRDAVAAALFTSPAPGARVLFEEGRTSSVWRVRKSCERAAGG
jgi:HEAT repeat protein